LKLTARFGTSARCKSKMTVYSLWCLSAPPAAAPAAPPPVMPAFRDPPFGYEKEKGVGYLPLLLRLSLIPSRSLFAFFRTCATQNRNLKAAAESCTFTDYILLLPSPAPRTNQKRPLLLALYPLSLSLFLSLSLARSLSRPHPRSR